MTNLPCCGLSNGGIKWVNIRFPMPKCSDMASKSVALLHHSGEHINWQENHFHHPARRQDVWCWCRWGFPHPVPRSSDGVFIAAARIIPNDNTTHRYIHMISSSSSDMVDTNGAHSNIICGASLLQTTSVVSLGVKMSTLVRPEGGPCSGFLLAFLEIHYVISPESLY
jgi:hypothetical protein